MVRSTLYLPMVAGCQEVYQPAAVVAQHPGQAALVLEVPRCLSRAAVSRAAVSAELQTDLDRAFQAERLDPALHQHAGF